METLVQGSPNFTRKVLEKVLGQIDDRLVIPTPDPVDLWDRPAGKRATLLDTADDIPLEGVIALYPYGPDPMMLFFCLLLPPVWVRCLANRSGA